MMQPINYTCLQAIMMLCLGIGFVANAQAQVGFAWADKPTAGRYTPSDAYSYTEAGGRIVIEREGTGHYLVQFSKLGRQGPGGGHVQVTAYGDNNDVCKVERWNYRGFDVHVRCFTADGRPTDSRFTVLAGWPRGGGGLVTDIEPIPPIRLLPSAEVEVTHSDSGVGRARAPVTQITVETLQEMIYNLHDQVEKIRRELNKLANE